ncbi:MAG: 16S rRNA (guanine(527)-N(7))-methyltransferase RsmG [Elusimicrobiota bacterium]
METYIKLLQKEKKFNNIIGVQTTEKIVNKLINPSIRLAQIIEGKKGVDVGTGGGIPGIILAIMEDRKKITLLEPKKDKVFFLESVKKELDLNNIQIIRTRAEEAGTIFEYRDKFNFGVCRAVANLSVTVELVLPLLTRSGIYYAEKGKNVREEVEEAHNTIEKMGGQVLDITEENIVIIKKVTDTPSKFPRSWNKIVK